MPVPLQHVILGGCLGNALGHIDVGLLKAPVHGLLVNAYQIDDQVAALDGVPYLVVVARVKVAVLDDLQEDGIDLMCRLGLLQLWAPKESYCWLQHVRSHGAE